MSNASVPTHQNLRASRKKKAKRTNSLYNRYGLASNANIADALNAMRTLPQQNDNSYRGVRKSGASIA